MRPTLLGPLVVAAVAVIALAACGGDAAGDREKAAAAASGDITCEGGPLAGGTGLPDGFPRPAQVTYVRTKRQGPTRVVNAYYDGGLEDAYEAYKDAFESAEYDVLFDEREEADAEVSYAAPGGATTGLVALKATCEDDRVSVRITSRAG